MTINICRNEGTLGGILISPDQLISISADKSIDYVITVNSDQEQIDLDGEFKIISDDVATGLLTYVFDQTQRDTYNITETQDGFTFRFSSNADNIRFKLNVSGFISEYAANIIVEAASSGFGSANTGIEIVPEIETIYADNFLDYQEEFGLEAPSEIIDTDITTEDGAGAGAGAGAGGPISNKASIVNEYNFYIEDYEKTLLQENSLLNINLNNESIAIKKYFSEKPMAIKQGNTFLFESTYMKNLYPILDKQKHLFPMYVEFRFETDRSKTNLTTFLEKLGMLDYFCYIYTRLDVGGTSNASLDNIKETMVSSESKNLDLGGFLGDKGKIRSLTTANFKKIILMKILEKQISDLPSLIQNQVLMYRMDKYKNDTLIDTKYFINKFENKEIIAFDTQTKYDTEYVYKISKIEIFSSAKPIVKTLIHEYTAKTKIVDSAPLAPDVSFIPFKGTDNEILINLNSNSGRYSDYPVMIRDSDKTVFANILKNRIFSKLPQNENKVEFESDDIITSFELFRLDTQPKSYDDFKDAYYLETNFTSILDTIKPNIKYYYILRAKDVHGNVSNPTKPIQIEIINENGTIFLLKKEYIFEDQKNKFVVKAFKNLIQLKPAAQQLSINNDKTYNADMLSAKLANLVLGNKEVSLWNKQFLMRVTSKITGKKIDIKFKYTYSKSNSKQNKNTNRLVSIERNGQITTFDKK